IRLTKRARYTSTFGLFDIWRVSLTRALMGPQYHRLGTTGSARDARRGSHYLMDASSLMQTVVDAAPSVERILAPPMRHFATPADPLTSLWTSYAAGTLDTRGGRTTRIEKDSMDALLSTFEGTDRFRPRAIIGRGSMGVVYRAFDTDTDSEV